MSKWLFYRWVWRLPLYCNPFSQVEPHAKPGVHSRKIKQLNCCSWRWWCRERRRNYQLTNSLKFWIFEDRWIYFWSWMLGLTNDLALFINCLRKLAFVSLKCMVVCYCCFWSYIQYYLQKIANKEVCYWQFFF